MAIPQGTRLGRYEIRSPLGAGGMGEVYLAYDLTLHRKVALKVLRADLTAKKELLQRFEREAFAASRLNHPNILTIYEIVRDNEYHFIVTEFVDGESLGQHIRSGSFKLHEILESASRSLPRWGRRMPQASCIETSSWTTSCSGATGWLKFWISVWRSSASRRASISIRN